MVTLTLTMTDEGEYRLHDGDDEHIVSKLRFNGQKFVADSLHADVQAKAFKIRNDTAHIKV